LFFDLLLEYEDELPTIIYNATEHISPTNSEIYNPYQPSSSLRNSASTMESPRDKAVRKSSKPERPLMSLDVISREKKGMHTSSPEFNRSTRESASQMISKPTVLGGNLFEEPTPENLVQPTVFISDEKAVPFEFQTKLVSNLSINDLFSEIEKILIKNNVTFTIKKSILYKYKCSAKDGIYDVQFAIEVIKKSDSLRGIKIKRTGGSVFTYQNVYRILLLDLQPLLYVV